VRAAVNELAPKLALTDFRTQEAQIEQLSATEAIFARLAVVFGALAVFLTCVGVYGLVAYRAARRTTEFGVRLALGAQPRAVLWLVWREGLVLGFLGALGGWAAAFGVVKLLESNLYGVAARDPLSFAGAGLLVVGVGAVAAALPAWRAARVDPAACLRTE
jgi:putative ABC transport system permease protein